MTPLLLLPMLLACWWRRHVHDYCTLTRSTQCRKGASGAFFGGEDLYHKLVEFLTRQLRSIYEVRSSLCACAPGRRSRCVVCSQSLATGRYCCCSTAMLLHMFVLVCVLPC